MNLDVIVPPSPCLGCGRINDMAASTFGGRGPKPGDFTICIDCGHLMAFAEDMTMRNLTGIEMIEVAGREDIILVQQARMETHGRKT